MLHELQAEEVQVQSHSLSLVNPSALAMSCRPQNQQHGKNIAHNQCSYCKEQGHWKNQCPWIARKGLKQPPPKAAFVELHPPASSTVENDASDNCWRSQLISSALMLVMRRRLEKIMIQYGSRLHIVTAIHPN
ncbi:hypothetical protein ACFX19_044400 [Malus domestica]